MRGIDSFYNGLPDSHHDGTVKTLLASGRHAGISHFIVHSVATKPQQTASINHFIAEETKKAGGAFTGLGTLHPDSETIKDDLENLISLGLKGVKLHPDFQKFEADSPKAFAIFEMCEDLGIPVLVHTGDYRYDYSNPERIARVLRAFPKLTFIGAHFGGWSIWDRATALLPDFANMRVDTSSSFVWLQKEKVKEIIAAYGPERVLFGTDYPCWNQISELQYMESLGLEKQELEQIYWKNCAKIYRIVSIHSCCLV